ncbi:conserved exported hypothetical protein [Vibrio chagasii]|nr:conserved exported hypothetical protein [Vibrio chagasii]CAH6805191.1 conserved exported hypothetical protein [Vibrio chagasii]CAH6853437.1 conserved exported hypothetical protein [Vibrio chagasii]CAH6958175.1 conserved exported hypothetical protein [Vibrio chagasii]CAH7120007.1 conserved exported hypothetical protein [Vibrio chagasii]
MRNKFLVCKLSLAISSALMVAGCGGSSDGENPVGATTSGHAFQSSLVCADADLNGVCSEQEKLITDVSGYAQQRQYDGAILTASPGMELVTPFTTLIHSEMMFNPTISNDIEQAKASLQSKLGDHVGVNFASLDTTYGPKDKSNVLLKSLKKAQTDGKQAAYTNIAHALDLMIEHKTLDLSGVDVAGTASRHLQIEDALVVRGSQSVPEFSGAKSIALNPASSQIVFLTANDVVMQIDSSSRNKPVTLDNGLASQANSGLISIRSHDDDYDDHDDDDDDDDDDHHGGGTGGVEIPVESNEIIQLVPTLNGSQAYKVYKPTSYASPTESDICNSKGANGIFLSSLTSTNNNSGAKAFKIDTYSSRSGGTLPPIPTPKPKPAETPDSSQSCINDNFTKVIPLLQSGSLLAVKNTGSSIYSQQEVRLLSADKLAMNNWRHALKSSSPQIMPSYDQSEALIVYKNYFSSANLAAEVINTTNLSTKMTIDKLNLKTANIVANQQILLGLDSNKLEWVSNSIQQTVLGELDVDSTISKIATSKDGKISAVATANTLYIVDNTNRTLVVKEVLSSSAINSLYVLAEKVIALTSSGVDYYQFRNISGPALKVGSQLVTKELLKKWEDSGNSSWNSTNLGYILSQTGTESSISDKFKNVNLSFSPSNATTSSGITGVNVSGLERGEWLTFYKAL